MSTDIYLYSIIMQLERQLKSNYDKQTAPFADIFHIYSSLLTQHDDYKQLYFSADSQLRELKNNYNDPEIVENLTRQLLDKDKYITRLEEEVDV